MSKITYDEAFHDGMRAAVTLMQAGATLEMLVAILPEDPRQMGHQAFQSHLAELRRIMHTDALLGTT